MPGKQALKQARPKKGEARTNHEEIKERCNLSLTPTAIAYLDAKATKEGISRSELVERIARTLAREEETPKYVVFGIYRTNDDWWVASSRWEEVAGQVDYHSVRQVTEIPETATNFYYYEPIEAEEDE